MSFSVITRQNVAITTTTMMMTTMLTRRCMALAALATHRQRPSFGDFWTFGNLI